MIGLAGCGASEPDPSKTDTPLSEVSPTPVVATNSRTPGPPIPAGCSLLSTVEVADATGLLGIGTTEQQLPPTAKGCRYQATNGWVMLFAAADPAIGTPEQAVNKAIGNYGGTLETVADLGDAALYSNDGMNPVVVAARLDGSQMVTVTLITFLPSVVAEDKVVGLVRAVLGRV